MIYGLKDLSWNDPKNRLTIYQIVWSFPAKMILLITNYLITNQPKTSNR